MNVFLALSLIMIFYLLFKIHDKNSRKYLMENFQGSTEDKKNQRRNSTLFL